jgi:site-specific recombinase XerD
MGASKTSADQIKVYKYDEIFGRAIRRLRSDSDISEKDRDCILRMVEHLLAKGMSRLRVVKYIDHLRMLARMAGRVAGKPLRQLGREDVERLVHLVNSANYVEETKLSYKVVLKKFFQWLRGCNEEEYEYPEEVRWIKTTIRKKRLLPEVLLTADEIRRLVEAAENQRDRALILTHYESGCRVCETLSLRIVNVGFDQYGAVLIVNGKTGPRRVRIIAAAPALASWLNIHPLRNDPNAPLWVAMGTTSRYEPLSYDGMRVLLRRLARKAGLNKRVYTHLLRHTRATELANILTEAQMKELLGWTQSSKMPSVYVHLSGRDIDNCAPQSTWNNLRHRGENQAQTKSNHMPQMRTKSWPGKPVLPKMRYGTKHKSSLKAREEEKQSGPRNEHPYER